jgi:hypothetical protein
MDRAITVVGVEFLAANLLQVCAYVVAVRRWHSDSTFNVIVHRSADPSSQTTISVSPATVAYWVSIRVQ